MLDPVEFGKAMAAIVKEATAPLLRRIEELEARESPAVPDVVREVLGSDALRTLVNMEAEAYLSENPPADGEKGEPGGDGAGIADLLIDRDGNLVATMTDGRMKNLGAVVGRDGETGRDGVDLTEIALEFDGDRTVIVRGKSGSVTKRLAVPLWRGYWSAGVTAEKGDIYTHNGTAYIAVIDGPKVEPGVGKYDHEWKVFTRKGRDGRDGSGVPKSGPVKLKGGDDA